MLATEKHRSSTDAGGLVVRPLRPEEVDEADRIMRTAFGTFLGAPDPLQVFGDAQYVRPRYTAEPSWAFGAELDGELVGSNFAARWGSYGFFGPLTVRPDCWDRGIGSALMEPVVELFERWQVRQAGLFTFPHSPRHIGLYQKFDFWPQSLTPVMQKEVQPTASVHQASTFSDVPEAERDSVLEAAGRLTDSIFGGLDVGHEIGATATQGLGDTVLLQDGDTLGGFAVCHLGAGEAGSGTCFIKFAAAAPGPGVGERFERLLEACEGVAAGRGLSRMVAGVNAARHEAYRRLLDRGYRTWMEGVVMQTPNEPGYCRSDVHVIDDLR